MVVADAENTEEQDTAAADDNEDDDEDDGSRHHSKKSKVVGKFQLDSAVLQLIKLDQQNYKLWEDCLLLVKQGQQVTLTSLSLFGS